MSIVFAAITPHPPILLPSVPANVQERLAPTRAAFSELEKELYAAQPEVIVIISAHTGAFNNSFTVNAHPNFTANFAEFGDQETKPTWQGAPALATKISHITNSPVPVRLMSDSTVDHGVGIPAFFLTEHLPNVKILPVGFSTLSAKQHLDFGEHLREVLVSSGIRVAIIASGDLSHALSARAPAGFNLNGKKFDRAIQELLFAKNTVGLTNLDPYLVSASKECGYRSILILLGALKNIEARFESLCYESPFGVGYLTGLFRF